MSNEPIRRVMYWKRIPIGITHDPGDPRHGRKVSASYGHIRGSYGDAEDGMSLDVWIGPDLGSDAIYRVKQVREDGSLDEYKYVIGTWSEKEAKALYLAHLPEKLFGGIEPVSLSALEKYQKPLAKAALGGGDELELLSQVRGLPAGQRLSALMDRRALKSLGPVLPPIHRILFD